jgi:agmatine deiminase
MSDGDKRIMNQTPANAGYYMPAEWEKHEGTWLQWPQNKIYTRYELKLEGIWLTMVDALHKNENVHLIVAHEQQRDHVAKQLQYHGIGLKNIDFHLIDTDDVWARDNGPIFVVNDQGEVAITDWVFNGWGERFDYKLDTLVPAKIGERLNLPVYETPMVLEAGAVEVNGHTHDERALKIIAEYFPDREVIGIEVVALIEHGGAIGCVTQP